MGLKLAHIFCYSTSDSMDILFSIYLERVLGRMKVMSIIMTWDEYESDVPVRCEVCGWEGRSTKAELRMPDETVAELVCPQCHNYDIALIS